MTSHSQIVADADLYTAIHNAIAEQPTVRAQNDRRQGERHAYRYIQLLAPFDGQVYPAQEDYSRVRCHDLSPTGFSYLADARPAAQQLVAALGRTPFRFFIAEVVNQRVIERDGKRKILVGCRFVGRIDS
jgi:hypothetical protein